MNDHQANTDNNLNNNNNNKNKNIIITDKDVDFTGSTKCNDREQAK